MVLYEKSVQFSRTARARVSPPLRVKAVLYNLRTMSPHLQGSSHGREFFNGEQMIYVLAPQGLRACRWEQGKG